MSKQTSAAMLLVGNTGSGKTSLLGTLAEFVWKKFGKVTRFATFDPGGYGDDVVALIKAGIIQVFRGYTRDPEGHLKLALETCSLVTRGYWPKEIDPETGAVKPGCDMVAPVEMRYTMFCVNGHPVRRTRLAQQLTPLPCPTCKTPTSRESCKEITTEMTVTPGFETIGAYSFDGLTSMSEWSLTDMAFRAGQNELGGEKAAINSLVSGGIKYGGTNRAAVGFVQTRAHEWVMNSLAIPNQVIPPTFTALELRATDDRTDLPVYGPKIAGQAKTAEIPQWFGNTLGTVIWPGDKGPEWRLYLQEYRMPGESAPHLCKVRTTPNVMPDFLCDVKEGVKGEPFSEFSLGRFYELTGMSLSKAEERLAERLAGVALPKQPTGVVGGSSTPVQKAGESPSAPPSAAVSTAQAAPAPITSPTAAPPPAAVRKAAPAAVPRAKAKSAAEAPSPAAQPPATPEEAPPPAEGEAAAVEAPAPPADVPRATPEEVAAAQAAGVIRPKAAPQAAPAPSPAAAAAPRVAPPGAIPPPQPKIQPPAPTPAPAAANAPKVGPAKPVAAAAAPAAGRTSVPPPAGARPAPRPPAAAPVAVKK